MALVELVGRLIYDNLALTQKELAELIDSGLSHLFLKMDGLKYLDSSALGMLLDLNNTARTGGMKLTMVGPPQYIRDIFASTRLDHIFKIAVEDEADQINSKFAEN